MRYYVQNSGIFTRMDSGIFKSTCNNKSDVVAESNDGNCPVIGKCCEICNTYFP
jgi:hypothetical protein